MSENNEEGIFKEWLLTIKISKSLIDKINFKLNIIKQKYKFLELITYTRFNISENN